MCVLCMGEWCNERRSPPNLSYPSSSVLRKCLSVSRDTENNEPDDILTMCKDSATYSFTIHSQIDCLLSSMSTRHYSRHGDLALKKKKKKRLSALMEFTTPRMKKKDHKRTINHNMYQYKGLNCVMEDD